jgi:hypothetical protein
LRDLALNQTCERRVTVAGAQPGQDRGALPRRQSADTAQTHAAERPSEKRRSEAAVDDGGVKRDCLYLGGLGVLEPVPARHPADP